MRSRTHSRMPQETSTNTPTSCVVHHGRRPKIRMKIPARGQALRAPDRLGHRRCATRCTPRCRTLQRRREALWCASIELPEDGSPPQLHFGVTAAFLVLDGESVTASMITTPSPKAERGAAPNVSQWIKLSHVEEPVMCTPSLTWAGGHCCPTCTLRTTGSCNETRDCTERGTSDCL